jgi:hypothetical protein
MCWSLDGLHLDMRVRKCYGEFRVAHLDSGLSCRLRAVAASSGQSFSSPFSAHCGGFAFAWVVSAVVVFHVFCQALCKFVKCCWKRGSDAMHTLLLPPSAARAMQERKRKRREASTIMCRRLLLLIVCASSQPLVAQTAAPPHYWRKLIGTAGVWRCFVNM